MRMPHQTQKHETLKRRSPISNPTPRKAIISIPSYSGYLFPDGLKTGLFYIEAYHPYDVFTKAGFEVDLASETGSYGIDEFSATDQFLVGADKAAFNDPGHPFNVKLSSQLKKASDLRKEDYDIFFAAAGHAALYDYPSARGLQSVAENIWTRGGIVAAVCHGPALLPGVIDSKTGKSIIAGRTVTGFTVEGEIVLNVMDKLKSDGVEMIVDAAKRVGAYYSPSNHPFDDYSISSGRVITGTNPASARSTAERVVNALAELSL